RITVETGPSDRGQHAHAVRKNKEKRRRRLRCAKPSARQPKPRRMRSKRPASLEGYWFRETPPSLRRVAGMRALDAWIQVGAERRQQGRVRAHQRGGARRHAHPHGRSEGQLRHRDRARQAGRGQSASGVTDPRIGPDKPKATTLGFLEAERFSTRMPHWIATVTR